MPSPRAKDVFLEALGHPPGERTAVVVKACEGDATLRAQVEDLLSFHEDAGQFLSRRAGEVDANSVAVANPGTVTPPVPVSEMLGTVIGRYKLLQQIGEGGFGVVYMAEQERPVRRKVALKIIKLGMDTRQVIARFEAERQALAMMDHPNIAKVLDAAATKAGRPYFVMELVKGVAITNYCDQEELALADRLRLFLSVCGAVHHAHQKGIIHRDIKPSNILVTLHDGVPVPKVIDFGIAKATEHKLTERTMFTEYGQFIGTPAYMSPEQAEMSGLDVDTRSDIYSLGVLLYELLTGSLPFDPQRLLSAGHVEMARIIKEEEPHRPSTRLRALGSQRDGRAVAVPIAAPGNDAPHRTSSVLAIARLRRTDPQSLVRTLRGDLDWIVMKCLEKDRTRRYETANDLARDVARFLAGETVTAAPPSTGYRLGKFLRRNRAFVTTVTLVVMALALGLVTTTVGFLQARQQRNAAQTAYAAEQEQRQIAVAERDKARDSAEELRHELYASTIEKIQRIIATDGVEAVKPLLQECDAGLRGWEWDRLNFLADRSARTVNAEDTSVFGVAYAADGSTFMSAAHAGVTRIWNAQTFEMMAELRNPEVAGQQGAALSHDGSMVAMAHGNMACLWEARTGRLIRSIKSSLTTAQGIALDATASRVAIAFWDGDLQVYDASTGELLLDPNLGECCGRVVAFSHDGSRLLLGFGHTSDIVVMSAADGRPIWRERGAGFVLLNAAFSPDDQFVASVGYDSRLWLRHAETGELVYSIATGKGASGAVAFHPEGELIAVGGIDGLISLFRTATGEKLYSLHGHETEVLSVDFHPTGRFLISGARDGTVKQWHMGNGGPQVTMGHIHVIAALDFLDAETLWVTGGAVRDMQVVRVAELARRPLNCPIDHVRTAARSPDGQRFALSGAMIDGTHHVMVTDAHMNVLRQWEQPEPAAADLRFSPDGKRLMAGTWHGPLRLYDIAANAVVWELGRSGQYIARNYVLFSRDGAYVINGWRDGTIRVFLAESGELVREFTVGPNPVNALALSFAGDLVFCGVGSQIGVWNWHTGEHLATMKGHTSPVTALAVMPGDARLVSGSTDATIRLWEVATGRQVMLVGRHDYEVSSIAVTHDGSTIATGGNDNAMRLWETRQPSPTALDARYERDRKVWREAAN